MIKKISKIEEFEKKLKEEGKIFYLDSPKDITIMVKMNKDLEEFRREYRRKSWLSEQSAKNTFLD